MAKTAKRAARNAFILFRIVGLVLVLAMLAPIFTVYRMFVKSNGARSERVELENDGADSIFAPLEEVQFIRPVRADIPPH